MTNDSRIDGDVNGDGVFDEKDIKAALNGNGTQPPANPVQPADNSGRIRPDPDAGVIMDPVTASLPSQQPADPAPAAPVVTDPAPADPVSTDPVSTDPVSTDPAASDPAPADDGLGIDEDVEHRDKLLSDAERNRQIAAGRAAVRQSEERLAEETRNTNKALEERLAAEAEQRRIEENKGRDFTDRVLGVPQEGDGYGWQLGRSAMRGTARLADRFWDATKGTTNFVLNNPDAKPVAFGVGLLAGGALAAATFKKLDETIGKVPILKFFTPLIKLALLAVGGIGGGVAAINLAPSAGRAIFKDEAERMRALSDAGLERRRTPVGSNGSTPAIEVAATRPEAEETAEMLNSSIRFTRGAAADGAHQTGDATRQSLIDPNIAGAGVASGNRHVASDMPALRLATVDRNGNDVTITPTRAPDPVAPGEELRLSA